MKRSILLPAPVVSQVLNSNQFADARGLPLTAHGKSSRSCAYYRIFATEGVGDKFVGSGIADDKAHKRALREVGRVQDARHAEIGVLLCFCEGW